MDSKTQKLIQGYVIYKLKQAGIIDGKSPYERAVEQGYIGSEEQWIADLNNTPDKVPYIGDNGNWYIDDVDMEVIATSYFEYVGNYHPSMDLSARTTEEEIAEVMQDTIEQVVYESQVVLIQNEEDLRDALDSVDDEISLGLIDDIALASYITIPEDKSVIINLGGNTLSSTGVVIRVLGTLNIINGSLVSAASDCIVIPSDGEVISTDVNMTASVNRCVRIEDGGTITINSGDFAAQEMCVQMLNNSTVTINGGNFVSADNGVLMDNGTPGKGNNSLTVNGGYFEGRIQSAGYLAFVVHHASSGLFDIKGGTFKALGGAGMVCRAGQLDIENATIICGDDENVTGWVGDSKLQIGCYPLVYCEKAQYPNVSTLEINVGSNVTFNGGPNGARIQYILTDENVVPNVTGL